MSAKTGVAPTALIASAVALACSAAAAFVAKPLPGAVFLLAAVRFALAGIYQLSTTATWQHIGGIVGLIVVAAALYCALAFELEGQKHRPVLPTFRRRVSGVAITDGAAAQVRGVASEAGVRQTT